MGLSLVWMDWDGCEREQPDRVWKRKWHQTGWFVINLPVQPKTTSWSFEQWKPCNSTRDQVFCAKETKKQPQLWKLNQSFSFADFVCCVCDILLWSWLYKRWIIYKWILWSFRSFQVSNSSKKKHFILFGVGVRGYRRGGAREGVG